MTDSPDLAGFKDAQVRLASYIGSDVDFYFAPSAATWGASAYIDPQTNLPLDPLIAAQSEIILPTVTAKAVVVRNDTSAVQGGDEARLGIWADGVLWLRLPNGEFDPSIMRATYCGVFSEKYRIMRRYYDAIDSVADTLYMQCELTSNMPIDELSPMVGNLIKVGPVNEESFFATAAQTTFGLSQPFLPGSTTVYLDGLRMLVGNDYTEVGAAVQFTFPLNAGQIVVVGYMP